MSPKLNRKQALFVLTKIDDESLYPRVASKATY
jgi:hypothetical protein